MTFSSKHKNLVFALFVIMFLNVLWVQNTIFHPKRKETGSAQLSSHTRPIFSSAAEAGCEPNSLFEMQVQNKAYSDSNEIREGRSRVTVNYGSRLRASKQSVECGGNQVHAIEVTLDRNLEDTECDACLEAVGGSSSTHTVYVLGELGDAFEDVFDHVVKQDRTKIRQALRVRSQKEKERRCEWVPNKKRRYQRQDPTENAQWYLCRLNFALTNIEDDSDASDRIIRREFSRFINLANKWIKEGKFDKARALILEAQNNNHFGSLSDRQQARLEGVLYVTEAAEETLIYNRHTGEEINLSDSLRQLLEARKDGNSELTTHYSLLSHLLRNQMHTQVGLSLQNELSFGDDLSTTQALQTAARQAIGSLNDSITHVRGGELSELSASLLNDGHSESHDFSDSDISLSPETKRTLQLLGTELSNPLLHPITYLPKSK